MVQIFILIIAACLAAIVIGRASRAGAWIARLGVGTLIYLAALIAWWFAMYVQVVPVDELMSRLGIYRLHRLPGLLLYFGPPLLPVVVSLAAMSFFKPHASARSPDQCGTRRR